MGAENTLTVRLVECAKTAAQWAALLTIPKRGEICLEMENQGTNENPDLLFKMKIGDGIHTYANLNYFPVDDNIAQVVANWVEQNLDVNEYAQASYDDATKKLSVYGIKEVDGKIVKGTNHVDIQLAEGTKIDITSAAGVITIAHEATTRTDTTKSSAGFGTNVVTGVTTDQTGHVTGVETAPLPTKPATKNVIGTSDAATTDGASANPYLNHIEDGDVKSHHQLIGGTQVDVNSDASGNVTIKHETITRSDAEESAQPTNLVTEITTANGHVTGAKTINPDDLIVGIAKDLDAPVTRSDNSMWNHRVTGGTISIGEDTARIPVLKGNTMVWNQLFNVQSIIGATLDNTTMSVEANKIKFVLSDNNTGRQGFELLQVFKISKFLAGHKYLFEFIPSSNLSPYCHYGQGVFFHTTDSDYVVATAIRQYNDININAKLYVGTEIPAGTYYLTLQVFDLTKMFGETIANSMTVEEFEAMFSNSYYPYNEGELLSLNPTGIKSVGFNLIDIIDKDNSKQYFGHYYVNSDGILSPNNSFNTFRVKVLPNTPYFYKTNDGSTFYTNAIIRFEDNNNNLISVNTQGYILNSVTFTTPIKCNYLVVAISTDTTTTYDLQLNISDSSRNGTYEPYKESTLDLSWIKSIKDNDGNQLFPYGLLSAGSVHDEVGDNYAIKRVDSVDMGTLTWGKINNYRFFAQIANAKTGLTAGNFITSLNYERMSGGTTISDGCMGFGESNNYFYIGDSNYETSTTSQFKAAMQGIKLYYELAEPVTVYFDKKPMTYPVDDLGTETLLPDGVDSTTGVPLSAPFNGTFEYKSNFKDAVIDLINAVNNYKNPVRGEDNSDQTVGQLAEYDSDSTVKASGYKASNATISPTGSDNASILPTVAALIAYVQGVAQNALHYQGTVATVASLPSTGTTTGDVYILSATDGDYDAGDWFIRNKANDGWDVVQGSVRVTNNDITLTPDGTKKTIANVEGTPITVTMPDMNFAEPAASGETLTVVDNISQTNGKILATKKNVQSASKSQKGVVQFVTDIHGSSDQTKGVTAADAWTEFGKRNVKAVEVDTVDSIETSSTTQEVIAEGLADLDARVLGIEASIKNGFTSLEVGELVVGYALFARIRRGDFILKGAGAPSASVVPVDWNEEKYGEWTGIPLYEGQIYIDTTNKIAYMAVGVSAVTDWGRITNA